MKIGVLLESFHKPVGQALKMAGELGVDAVQVYAIKGELSPENLKGQALSDFKKAVADSGLRISALCGDLGGGFMDPAANPKKIEKSKAILDLAKELGTNIVTTHIGIVPADVNSERFQIMQEACYQLAEYANSLEAHFAVETGPETAVTLKRFLDTLGSKGVAVNFDPANFVMVTGDDPVKGVFTLADYIVHTHAKDGIKLYDLDPEKIYNPAADVIITSPAFAEMPLGQGKVDFSGWIGALRQIGYDGYLTIERETGENPTADIRAAVQFLKNQLR
ncbi:xylose isomerase [Lachnospiraceae bacterium oral taxon 500]|nr:xylose isomerase [Lachnospiraceae bacterium oral taxon 500]